MKALQFSVTVPQYAVLSVLGRLNKQFYYRGPLATIRLADVPEPTLPSSDWVKIKTLMCGMCGSDVSLIFLKDSPAASPFTSFPCTIGHEFCGQVVEVGENVDGIKAGELVTVAPHLGCATRGIETECRACSMGRPANCENFAEGDISPGLFIGISRDLGGGFAPHLVAHKSQIFKLPQGVSPKEGAMIEPLSVTLQAVLDNMPGKDDQVLIIGGGVIGNLIIQSIRALGTECPITVAEPSRFHAALVSQTGANNLITDGDILNNTVRITGAKAYKPLLGEKMLMGGFTKIFDTVASTRTLNDDMRVLRTGGVLSVVGIGKEVKIDLTPLWLKLQTIKGVYCFGYTDLRGKREHVFEIAIDLVKQKKVSLEPMVTHVFALEDYREMIEVNVHKGKYKAVKTMVRFT